MQRVGGIELVARLAAKDAVEKVRKDTASAKQIAQIPGARVRPLIARPAAGRPLRPIKVSWTAPRLLPARIIRAQLVVFLALFRVREDLVGLVDLFEPLLSLLVPGIDVGMILARQLAIGGLDLFGGSVLGHSQALPPPA